MPILNYLKYTYFTCIGLGAFAGYTNCFDILDRYRPHGKLLELTGNEKTDKCITNFIGFSGMFYIMFREIFIGAGTVALFPITIPMFYMKIKDREPLKRIEKYIKEIEDSD
jgi:hypothetical protein